MLSHPFVRIIFQQLTNISSCIESSTLAGLCMPLLDTRSDRPRLSNAVTGQNLKLAMLQISEKLLDSARSKWIQMEEQRRLSPGPWKATNEVAEEGNGNTPPHRRVASRSLTRPEALNLERSEMVRGPTCLRQKGL